jgi:RNA polymerase sigma-B factor
MSNLGLRESNAALVALMAQRPPTDRDDLIEQLTLDNVEVARSVARRFSASPEFRPDLEQVACVALVRAAREFEPARDVEFLAYAVPCMTGAIKHYFRDVAWSVRPPRSVQQRHLSEDAPGAHFADGVAVESCFRPRSLDVPVNGAGSTLGAILRGDDKDLRRADDRLLLAQLLQRLSPAARRLIHLRFVEDLTQQEIADRIGVSQYHVSRLLTRHLGELRQMMGEAA